MLNLLISLISPTGIIVILLGVIVFLLFNSGLMLMGIEAAIEKQAEQQAVAAKKGPDTSQAERDARDIRWAVESLGKAIGSLEEEARKLHAKAQQRADDRHQEAQQQQADLHEQARGMALAIHREIHPLPNPRFFDDGPPG